jgi:2-polyprenyl-6-methoxyphenol hydroxylase-like FAD-dependent oxidoreductase
MDSALIIGAGPAGMACALSLAQRGFKVKIVDRRRERSPVAKATGVNLRCCRWLSEQGIELRDEAIPMQHFVFYDDERLVANVRLPLLSGATPAYLFPQAELERRMETALFKHGITIRYGVTLAAVNRDGGNPSVIFQALDGAQTTEEADWVVGADGGHSTLRQMLAVPFVGRDYPEAWSVAEVYTATWDNSAQARLYLHGDGSGLFLSQPSPGVVQGILNGPDVIGAMRKKLPDAEVAYVRDFRVALRRAQTPYRGKFWLIGDAAHTQSPVGGQGLNLAIRDGVTLGSELGERAPEDIARQLINQAKQTLRFTDFDYRMLSTRSRLLRHTRNAYWRTAARYPWIAHWFFKLIAGQ